NPGEQSSAGGKMLEVIPGQRFVFTDAFGAGWIPQKPFMIGTIEILPEGGRTRYTGSARHWSAEDMMAHQDMGFDQGWGSVADQLKALAEDQH
ncbi:MAG: SRPBCC domain-containing protein, partial [Sphingomonadaceae bacterium]